MNLQDRDAAELRAAMRAAFGEDADALLEEDAREERFLEHASPDNDLQGAPPLDFEDVDDDFDFVSLANSLAESCSEEAFGTTDAVGEQSDDKFNAFEGSLRQLLKQIQSNGDDADTRNWLSQCLKSTPDTETTGSRYVLFVVGDQQFALPLTEVREIDRCGGITFLPKTPDWLRGVTNLRGEIVSVTDFRRLLNLSAGSCERNEKIIVVHSQQYQARTALVVERVLGIRSLHARQDMPNHLGGRMLDFAESVAVEEKHESDDPNESGEAEHSLASEEDLASPCAEAPARSTILINPDKLLGCSELRAFSDP